MGLKTWFAGQSEGTRIAIIGGTFTILAGVLAAVVAGIFAIISANSSDKDASKDKDPKPSRSAARPTSSPTAPAATSTCAKKLRVLSPKNGAKIVGPEGVSIVGEACGLQNEYGWVFDRDYDSGYLYFAYAEKPAPAVSKNGRWGVRNQPMGNEGDNETPYTITVVLASEGCNRVLLALKSDHGDYRIRELPGGCEEADRIDVTVTWKESLP
ncbi:hypothetical protein [Actinomadura rubrisoli]|uniref:Uncharacterized protein n=1 Tax=Actinomadura rubrisoli TaxID=2530368 RepID=A0A4R5B4G9_9ACTN|nr:hypothetical protein [Actinomadura rubrisoli]TDD81118.1 hypothetical protein E1298_24660 [Actinomadura rubrisoli]